MKYKKTSLLAIAVALALTLSMATGFATSAVAMDAREEIYKIGNVVKYYQRDGETPSPSLPPENFEPSAP